ncbi:MAG: SNF2-related protein [Desulfonatronovibrionaceae bacterium]
MDRGSEETWYRMLYDFFPPHIRTRGNAYFKDGRVNLEKADKNHIKGTVSGSRKYQVEVISEEDRFGVFCSCPHFASGEACKHLWAAARKADSVLEGAKKAAREKKPQSFGSWRKLLSASTHSVMPEFPRPGGNCPYYCLLFQYGEFRLLAWQRYVCQNGRPGKRASNLNPRIRNEGLPEADCKILAVCMHQSFAASDLRHMGIKLDVAHLSFLLPFLAETGRCSFVYEEGNVKEELKFGHPYQADLIYEATEKGGKSKDILLAPRIMLGEKILKPGDAEIFIHSEPIYFIYNGGLHVLPEVAWETVQQQRNQVQVPEKDIPEMMSYLTDCAQLDKVSLPDRLIPEQIFNVQPRARAVLEIENDVLRAELHFDYDGLSVLAGNTQRQMFDASNWRVIHRQPDAEEEFSREILKRDFERTGESSFTLPLDKNAAEVLREFNALGWRIEGKKGKPLRGGMVSSIHVKSGQDWFDLQGEVDFGEDVFIPLPQALEAYRRGERLVVLDDGSLGMLPEKWLAENGLALNLGKRKAEKKRKKDKDGAKLRFTRAQGALLAGIDDGEIEVSADADFARLAEKIHTFDGIQGESEPEGLNATLRDYQKDGLGWLGFLREFGLGGILADDMGLGKTIQVLARFQAEKKAGRLKQSLIIAPTSLALNWIQEGQRFTPGIAFHLHAGPGRLDEVGKWKHADLIVTTYTLLRMDIELFAAKGFDYIILDESQAIKNAQTQIAQCSRRLHGRSRLCLTGTPLENHAGELWSQMEFLNPGLLGSLKGFESLFDAQKELDEADLAKFHKFMRPFLLRRTKEEVIQDLPPKMEKVINCEMYSKQEKMYKQVRDHLRSTLLSQVEEKGLGKSKMQILEGLLRLRQIACHPALAGEESGAGSGKLQELKSKVLEVTESGHKALVFSQFTRFLGLIKESLDAMGVRYCYLDGRTPTKRRQERIKEFQSPDGPPVFLISIKAGGTGLNLTAADYVFIADPWWNPAVEMQAVDRTHRIGQDKKVFTYRLVTSGTVEEKIRSLQEKKQELISSVLSGSSSVVRSLSQDDLKVLFS